VQRHVEAQPELLGIELEGVGDEDQMRGRAHRQELGEPLHQPEDDRRRLVADQRMFARAARSAS